MHGTRGLRGAQHLTMGSGKGQPETIAAPTAGDAYKIPMSELSPTRKR